MLRGDRHLMRRRDGGWFEADLEAAHGDRYGFRLDGGDPLPDPRSPWQPDGPAGLSAVVDHNRHRWDVKRWPVTPLEAAVVYELHVGTFTPEGTFESAISRLDHLAALGVTAVELMPVAEFSGSRGWGYDGVDLYAPHHAYGGPEGLKRLVDACHGRGLAVVVDVVYNHLGPVGNHLGAFGPYFTDRYATPWGRAINYDGPGAGPVRQFVIGNALAWLRDYRCDGLRLDAVHAIHDSSALGILEELGMAVERLSAELGRPLFVIAESDLNDPRLVRSREAGGDGLDAQWSDDFHHALHALLTGERRGYYEDFGSLADLARALRRAFVYDGRHSRHRDRPHGRPASGLPGTRFLGYLQNHDQVGNRLRGERSSALMSEGRLRIGAAMVLASPFVPMLFMGEEWAASTPFLFFSSHEDPEIGRLTTQGRAREFESFGWRAEDVPDPQDEATFERSRLDWSELAADPHRGMLDWHRDLIALRRREPSLAGGRLDQVEVRWDEDRGWLLLERERLAVAFNLGPTPVDVQLGGPGWRPVMSFGEVAVAGSQVRLGSDSVAVLDRPSWIS